LEGWKKLRNHFTYTAFWRNKKTAFIVNVTERITGGQDSPGKRNIRIIDNKK